MEFKQFTGLRSDRPIERFDPTDLSVGQNIDIDNSGAISRRAGYTSVPTVPAGAKHSLWSDDLGTIAMYVSGANLCRVNSDLSATVIMSGLTPNLRMVYRFENDRVYFVNGQQSGVYENGVVRSWGISPPNMFNAAVTSGQMTAGSYQFTMTYVRNDGQESGAPVASVVTIPDGSGLILTLPISSDTSVVSKNIYLSTPNGDSHALYLAMNVPNTQISATYTGDTSELNLPLITQFLGGAPLGHLIGHYRGVMYVAVGDTLYPSEEFAYELFDLRKGIPLKGKVTVFAALDDSDSAGVFACTNKNCGILSGKGPSDFQYVPKLNYGAIEGSIVYIDGSLYGDDSAGGRMLPMWLSAEGICVGLPNLTIRNLTRTRHGFYTDTGKGAAIFIPGPNRLIMSSNY
jgi:hypothetical protein